MARQISPRSVMAVLLVVVASLTALGIAAKIQLWEGGGRDAWIVAWFDPTEEFLDLDLSREGESALWSPNIPTMFATLVLLACSFRLADIARRTRAGGGRYNWHWMALSLVFLFFTLEEAFVRLHSRYDDQLQAAINSHGFLYYPTAVPMAVLGLIIVLAFWRFFEHLARPVRVFTAIAAGLYAAGGLGSSFIYGFVRDSWDVTGLELEMWSVGFEVLEMLGVVVFFHALGLQLRSLDKPALAPAEGVAGTASPLAPEK